jgi:hypothetical protein
VSKEKHPVRHIVTQIVNMVSKNFIVRIILQLAPARKAKTCVVQKCNIWYTAGVLGLAITGRGALEWN